MAEFPESHGGIPFPSPLGLVHDGVEPEGKGDESPEPGKPFLLPVDRAENAQAMPDTVQV